MPDEKESFVQNFILIVGQLTELSNSAFVALVTNLSWRRKFVKVHLYRAIDSYSTKIYILLHFEHKNDVTIIVKLLYRARSHRRFIMIVTSFLCSKCNGTDFHGICVL